MASLTPTPPLAGHDVTLGGNRIAARPELALVSVAVPLGGDAALAARLMAATGLEMPAPTLSSVAGGWRAVSMTADQLLVMTVGDGTQVTRELTAALDGAGYTTNQTDAWVCLEVSGPAVHAALERICPLDLAPEAFPVNAAARTMMEHLGVLILRLAPDRFLLCAASSSALSFAHSVQVSLENVL